MLRNLDIFILETLSHMTRRVALANGGEAMPYSDLSVGRIEGLQRTIPALVADGVTEGDNWYVVNLIDNTNNMSRYVQSVAVLGATSQEQAREWALKNIGAFIGANDAWNTAYTSTKVLKTFLNRPSTSVAMIAIRQGDLDTIARQITDKPVVWDGSRLVSHDATSLLHELVKHDDEVMMMDAMTPADLPILMVEMGGELAEYDALIVDYNRLELLMQRLNAAMQKSSVGNVKPVNVTQSKPFKRNSVTNVAALFEMSDGQSVTIVFHSPDNTPAKLSPSDTLTSWKWMLNKRDISAAVSPKNGENVQMPDLAKRILTIVEKNSARFIRANGNKAAQIQELTDTNTRIGQKQEALAGILAVNKDLQRQIDEAGKQAESAISPEIERIASLYAAALGQPVSKRSREFASDILSKNAYGLEFIANGMNDKGKKVFSEVTGISLPKQQGATWKAIRDWAGISDEQEAYRVAVRDVDYAVKSFMRDNSVSQAAAEQNKALIASKIAEGFDSVQKIGKDYWLTNKEGQGINLSERPKKGYLGLSKSRALVEAMITESKAKRMLDSGVVQSVDLVQQEPVIEPKEPEKPYSENIITALVANHGWTASTNSSATKEFTGMAVGGELSDGTRMLTARFDDKGRYIGIDKDGFDSTPIPETDMDMRDYMTDAQGGAKAFNDMVEAYVAKQRKAVKPAPVAAPTLAAKSTDLTDEELNVLRKERAEFEAKTDKIGAAKSREDALKIATDLVTEMPEKEDQIRRAFSDAIRNNKWYGNEINFPKQPVKVNTDAEANRTLKRLQKALEETAYSVNGKFNYGSAKLSIIYNNGGSSYNQKYVQKSIDKINGKFVVIHDVYTQDTVEFIKPLVDGMLSWLNGETVPKMFLGNDLKWDTQIGTPRVIDDAFKEAKAKAAPVTQPEQAPVVPEPTPAITQAEPAMTNPDQDTNGEKLITDFDNDFLFLQMIVNGTTNALTVDMDSIIAMAEKYDSDAKMMALIDQALEVINQAEQEAAKGI